MVGGVGFYERKEVKDVLAYLRLVLNPRDAVAFRRVVNVPPRGIGAKTVEEIDRAAATRGTSPWEAVGAPRRRGGPARAGDPRAAPAVPGGRRDAAGGGARARPAPGGRRLRRLIERVLELSGYGAALAREDSQESQDRLENLAELLGAAADYEAREEAPSLAGFLDRAALLSDDRPPARRRAGAADDPPRRQGARVRVGLPRRARGGPRSRTRAASPATTRSRRSAGSATSGMTRAMERLHLSWARSRQVFGQRRVTEPSRFLDRDPGGGSREHAAGSSAVPPGAPARPRRAPRPAGSGAGLPARRGAPPRPRIRPGARVRHPLFGVGTVLRREGEGDDLKVTVSFPGVGAKKLVARFAGLEIADLEPTGP